MKQNNSIINKIMEALTGVPSREIKGFDPMLRYGTKIGYIRAQRTKWYRKPYGYTVLGYDRHYAGTAYSLLAAFEIAEQYLHNTDKRKPLFAI